MNDYHWQIMKKQHIPAVENLLCSMENNYVAACSRFRIRTPSTCNIWMLCRKKKELSGLIIHSRSTVIPVLCGIKEMPEPEFLKSLVRKKKIHSVQGLTEEVLVLEEQMKQTGAHVADVFDYDLMSLDYLPAEKDYSSKLNNLVLRVPQLTDLNEIAPLQAAYEQEEVLPKGSTFNPAASRINIANIVAQGKILAAELDGRLIAKINVSGESFTRHLVGGVYVHPDFRGLGIARRMAAEFIASLINEGKGVTLFVKKNNIPARRLYLGLGFKVKDDYRITYY